jgi:hypothetical protein
MEFLVLPFKKFPTEKSDFLGIFKNVLTGFYCIMKFVMNNSPHCALNIGYEDKYIEETVN